MQTGAIGSCACYHHQGHRPAQTTKRQHHHRNYQVLASASTEVLLTCLALPSHVAKMLPEEKIDAATLRLAVNELVCLSKLVRVGSGKNPCFKLALTKSASKSSVISKKKVPMAKRQGINAREERERNALLPIASAPLFQHQKTQAGKGKGKGKKSTKKGSRSK